METLCISPQHRLLFASIVTAGLSLLVVGLLQYGQEKFEAGYDRCRLDGEARLAEDDARFEAILQEGREKYYDHG